jgi:predicted XRE-type DNA-binding protein
LKLVAWEAPLARSTKDIDLLGRMNNTIKDVVDAIKADCSLEVIPDGLLFDVKSVVGQRFAEEAEYLKIRSTLMIHLRKTIDAKGMKQAEAAKLLGVTQPRVSDLYKGKIHLFSIDTLVDMLARV